MSTFAERLAGANFPAAVEIIPPKNKRYRILHRRASFSGPRTVDIVQKPDRQNSLDAAAQIAEYGFDTIWHLVTNGTNPDDLRNIFEFASRSGLQQVLIVGGDATKTHQLTVTESVRLATQEYSSLFPGVAFDQYKTRVEAEIRTAAAKARAGARYIQTQPIFDLPSQRPIFERLKSAACDSKLVAMCMPLTSMDTAFKMQRTLGTQISPAFLHELQKSGPEWGWQQFQETVEAISESGLFDGLVVMTLEPDPTRDTGARINTTLKSIGC